MWIIVQTTHSSCHDQSRWTHPFDFCSGTITFNCFFICLNFIKLNIYEVLNILFCPSVIFRCFQIKCFDCFWYLDRQLFLAWLSLLKLFSIIKILLGRLWFGWLLLNEIFSLILSIILMLQKRLKKFLVNT